MNKKMIGILVGVVLVGGLIAAWFLHIRYAVEGGKVVWATRYAEPEAIAQAIEEGPEQSALDKALRIAVEDGDREAAEMLNEAGASINPDEQGFCQLASEIRFGRVESAALALDVGADPQLCDVTPVEMMDDLLRFGHDNAPQAKIIEVMSALVDAGGDPLESVDEAGPSILALSEKYELDRVSKYLRAPDAYEAPEEGEALGRPHGVAGAVELDDLKKVCYGKGIEDAAPYEKSNEYAASVFYFEKRHDLWRYPGRRHGVTLPKWWTTWDEPADAQLVACVDMTDKTKVDTCHYEGRGGGVYVYEANVEIALREAKTGNLIDEFSQTMKPARNCPNIKFGKDQEGIYPAYDEQLQDFLRPHVGGPR
jgi:hypothetical protein